MRLRDNIVFTIGLIWVIFFGFQITLSIYAAPAIMNIILSVLFAIVALSWLQYLFNKKVKELSENETNKRVQHLENKNRELERKIKHHKSIEKDLIIHKEYLVRLAHYDSLTALPNRIFFNQILNKTLTHAKRHKKLFSILFIDIDRFKKINDTLGHAYGDIALKEIANRLANLLRAGDVLARLGGDEFIILLSEINHPKFVGLVAEKILKAMSVPIQINQQNFEISTSIGISIYPDDGHSLEDLLANADMAMYQAKKSGGSVYQYFTAQMNLQAHEFVQLEKALQKAIQNQEFVLYYQPIYHLSDGLIIGAEALIRWDSKEYGFVNPGKFIPIAEETGLILPIGEWAIREACRAARSWQIQGLQPIPVSVNLSLKQFLHPDILDTISRALTDNQLDPKYLEIEIAESMMTHDTALAIERLLEFKKMRIRVSIDDFGIGYSSIHSLKNYPASILKIDQHFIKGIPNNTNDVSLTAAIIAFAHSLGMKVVAEGVETAEQLQYLADHDCDIVQGYYLNRPLPEKKMQQQLMHLPDTYET